MFVQVKIVRETMNRSLDLWKEVHGVCEEASAPNQLESSSIGIIKNQFCLTCNFLIFGVLFSFFFGMC